MNIVQLKVPKFLLFENQEELNMLKQECYDKIIAFNKRVDTIINEGNKCSVCKSHYADDRNNLQNQYLKVDSKIQDANLNARDPKTWHIAFSEHADHDIYITSKGNHSYLWCESCRGIGTQDNEDSDYLVFKTYQYDKEAVGFPIMNIIGKLGDWST